MRIKGWRRNYPLIGKPDFTFPKSRLVVTDSTNNQPASKTPTHIAYHVRNREGGKGFWTRIRTR
jgi:hypothetical protein